MNKRRKKKKKIRSDWTLNFFDFFAAIGRLIKRGYLRLSVTRHFRAVSSLVAILFCIGIGILIFFGSTRPNALEIHIDDTPIGSIRVELGSRQISLDYIILHTTARLETQFVSDIDFISEISATPVRLNAGTPGHTLDSLVSALINALDFNVHGAIIKVNGEEFAVVSSGVIADNLLADIAQSARQGANPPFGNDFVEVVEILRRYMPHIEIMSYEDAKAALTTSRPVPDVHIVQSGDSLYSIASYVGMSFGEIIIANPDINIQEHLYIGQAVSIVRTVPPLNVRTQD